ncbi:MAG: FAD binding domain-containing protein [Alphaproteobacteria bacterium]|jgi:CO/xanthine dehydrogenase FAD-binding subunit|nr:FAD binding domain-containing protein [Alphaproteobacteria bacterium]MDP6516684.1 FAD binding domain-containing protein [Alphaproteobacteria bacterium]
MVGYARPTKLSEALAALDRATATVIAGGTDVYPAHVGRAVPGDLLDISAVAELRGIADRGDHWRVGALATWTDLSRAPLPALFDGLKCAASAIGGIQIQNAGTLCGNLCNASPAADGIPAMMSLDGRVELSSVGGIETLPVGQFVTGNRRTARRPNQLMTAILIPKPAAPRAYGAFTKLGARASLVISIVMVAAVIEVSLAGVVVAARVAVGACSPLACRLPALEAALVGEPLTSALGGIAQDSHLGPLAPIDDARASAAYRRDAALTVIRRTLESLAANP